MAVGIQKRPAKKRDVFFAIRRARAAGMKTQFVK
jgi:hypothetical protein